jgi:phospholipid/cholesterol/gamma-HCH transport system ATP-binding protein
VSTTFTTSAPGSLLPPGEDPVIQLRQVTKRFGSHTVLKDLSFDIPRGKISAVLGPSGTGKSVLLKNIIGLLRPEAGQIYVDGEPIVGIRHKDMLRIRRKFGVLFQDGALFGSMDIFDNIAFPLREHTKKSDREIKALVLEKAEMVGMVAHLRKLPGEISGGMRKRAGLARALILDPEIVFFDEPDSGLDPVRVAYLDELVKSVQRETGCTFFIITHNIDSVKRVADFIGMLYRSSLVRFGPAADMFVSDRALIKQFLAGSNVGPIGMDEMVDAARGEADIAALLADGHTDESRDAKVAVGQRATVTAGPPRRPRAARAAGDDDAGPAPRIDLRALGEIREETDPTGGETESEEPANGSGPTPSPRRTTRTSETRSPRSTGPSATGPAKRTRNGRPTRLSAQQADQERAPSNEELAPDELKQLEEEEAFFQSRIRSNGRLDP